MTAPQAPPRRQTWGRPVLLAAVPVAYAGLLLFHPVPGAGSIQHGLDHHLTTWTVVHVAQLGFIGAMGGVILLLVHGLTARSATAARVSAVVFVLVYGAYETWTGIATGALTASAHGLRADEQATAAELIQTHWDSPLLGNGSAGAIAGSAAWLVATVAAALALRGRGAPTGAAVALAGAGVVFTPTHVPPAGPLAMLLFALAVICLERGRRTGTLR